MPYKWTGVFLAVVLVPTTATANLLVDTLTDREVPDILNLFAVATSVVAVVVAFVAHIYQLTMVQLNSVAAALSTRLDDLEARFGDYNAGFVSGYLLGDERDPAAVVSLFPRSGPRRAVTDD